MKSKILVLFIVIFTFICNIQKAQQLSQDQINSIIDSLSSSSDYVRIAALYDIREYKIVEAESQLIQKIWTDSLFVQAVYLEALNSINSPSTLSYTERYINILDSLKSVDGDQLHLLKYRVKAIGVLFELGYYSQAESVLELLNRENSEINAKTVLLLKEIILHRNDLENEVKQKLVDIASNFDSDRIRIRAIKYLVEIYNNDETLNQVLQMLSNDSSPTNRLIILKDILNKYNSSEIRNYIEQRLQVESIWSIRVEISKHLMLHYETPLTHKFILDYSFEEVNDTAKYFIQKSLTRIDLPKPDSTISESEMIDTLNSYNNQCYGFGWINNANTYDTLSVKLSEIQNDISTQSWTEALSKTGSYLQYVETALAQNNINEDAYKFLRYYGEYIQERLSDLAVSGTPSLNIKLKDSNGNILIGGSLMYYEGGWKDAIDNGNGTFIVNTEQTKVSLRMTYEYTSQTISNVTVTSDTFAFQTVNVTVQLQDSQNNLITDEATVKYYSGGWRDFGTTVNGVATKELLPNNYSFRMTYAFASKDKQQNLNENITVVFQTVNTEVQLQDSQGNPITDESTVKYYSGGWRDFGTTVNGTATKELLPNNYSFRMTYAYASKDKQQNLNKNTNVVFQTVNTQVQLQNSQGNPITEDATVKYYSGGWRDFGTTVNGTTTKELLPNNYSFRMTYDFASNDKQQNLNDNTTVLFQTVNTSVQLKDSQENPVNEEATVKYYSGGWRDFGTTVNGAATKELLPNNYSFRMTYAFASNDKQQNLNDNTTVVFQSVNTQVQLNDSQGNPITEEATVRYYSGGWRDFGTTVNGTAAKELLPNNYSFRMTYAFISNDKQQNTADDNNVVYSTVLCRVNVKDSQNQPIDNADVKYYSGGWRDFGTTVNGEVTKELMPANLNFRATYNGTQQSKTQDITSNNTVELILP